jgi:hypothetical protein
VIRPRTLRRRLAFRLRWPTLLGNPFNGVGRGPRLPLTGRLLGPLAPLARGRPLAAGPGYTLDRGTVRTDRDRPAGLRLPRPSLVHPVRPLLRLLLAHRLRPNPPPAEPSADRAHP